MERYAGTKQIHRRVAESQRIRKNKTLSVLCVSAMKKCGNPERYGVEMKSLVSTFRLGSYTNFGDGSWILGNFSAGGLRSWAGFLVANESTTRFSAIIAAMDRVQERNNFFLYLFAVLLSL